MAFIEIPLLTFIKNYLQGVSRENIVEGYIPQLGTIVPDRGTRTKCLIHSTMDCILDFVLLTKSISDFKLVLNGWTALP